MLVDRAPKGKHVSSIRSPLRNVKRFRHANSKNSNGNYTYIYRLFQK